jgi:hypothetical protein
MGGRAKWPPFRRRSTARDTTSAQAQPRADVSALGRLIGLVVKGAITEVACAFEART